MSEDEFEDDEIIEIFDNGKTELRKVLCNYKICIEYKDVFDKKLPSYERSLEWFGRNE